MNIRFSALWLALILSLGLSACANRTDNTSPTVLVAAASDLEKVSRPLARAFEQSNGMHVTFGFGSSVQLEQQIRQGAFFDVFAPAERSFCRSLAKDGLTDGPERPFAVGRLVVWSKALRLSSLEDLAGDKVRSIAMGNPKLAPYGMAAKQALEKAGLWATLQPKIVFGETVAHALQMAETGNADAVFVALSLVQDSEIPYFPVDQKLYTPLEPAAVVLKESKNKQAAKAFLDFLGSDEAQRILEQYGFSHLPVAVP